MNLDYEGDNIKAGTYTIQVEGQNGDLVNINLIFDGGSRVPSGREYELRPDENGVSIDGILYAWNTMTNASGATLDPNNIVAGTYKFRHAGMTISFETDDNMDVDSLIGRLQQGGLTTYKLKSSNVTTVTQRVNPYVSITDVDVTAAKQQYIPGNTTSNTSRYEMRANDTGLYMIIPADQSHGQGTIELTHRTWEELGITDEDFMATDVPNNSGINPDSTVTGGESSRIYTYTDDITGISVDFTIDSEISKNELISSVNNWEIKVTTNNKMVFTPGGGSGISAGSHSPALDAYGTQYQMGRDMESQMTLQSGMDINNNGTALSFTMADNAGNTYNMVANNAASLATTSIRSALSSYISRYRAAYQNRLNGYGSTAASSSGTVSMRFTEENNSNYWMNLNCNVDFSGWLSDSDFSVSTYTDINGNTRYNVTYNSSDILNRLSSNISTLATEVVNKMDASTMKVTTDNNNITANNSITSSTVTRNKRYSSSREVGDREIYIQVGANSHQAIKITLPALDSSILGIAGIDVSNHSNAGAAISATQAAIEQVSEMRSNFGAIQNRLEFASSVDDISAENLQASESRIRDADMAEEMVAFSKSNILTQAAQSMLAQANQLPNGILNLLQ